MLEVRRRFNRKPPPHLGYRGRAGGISGCAGRFMRAVKHRDPTSADYLVMFTRATERVAVQACCSHDAAIDLMLERADTDRCSLGDLAIAIIAGTVRFDT